MVYFLKAHEIAPPSKLNIYLVVEFLLLTLVNQLANEKPSSSAENLLLKSSRLLVLLR